MKKLTEHISRHNFWWFLWHSGFLALATSFIDVDTVMPSVITESGGGPFHIGLLVSIMLGGSSVSQLLFASYLHKKSYKKTFLLMGINLRVLSLFGLAAFFFLLKGLLGTGEVWFILALVSVFSFSGAFANISYIDIMGKSILKRQRKSFLSLKQVVFSIGILISAFAAFCILSLSGDATGYGVLFLLAATFLLTATLGFWRLREVEGRVLPIKGSLDFVKFIVREIQSKTKLRNYLLIISSLGNILGIMAFMVLYTRMNSPTQDIQVGSMLLIKVIGAVITGLALYYFSRKFKYGKLLYIAVVMALFLPLLALIFSKSPILFMSVFFVGGVLITIYIVSMGGILLEISTKKDRSLYAGAAGAGSIIPAIFSMVGGWVILNFGFNVFFIVFAMVVTSSLFFINKLNCRK
ncbi:MAG: hypothetical protein KAH57_03810 [Thermoplasmata archaeon]|nr:hypothetical protein [Thermoplasmata archaeon]